MKRIIQSILLILALGGIVQADQGERIPYDQTGPFPFKTLEFSNLQDETRNHRLVPLKVHYPQSGSDCPLVIISHGAGGNWDANLYQARHLASYGYVVICVEHVKSNDRTIRFLMSSEGGSLKFLEALHRITTDPEAVLGRPLDVRLAIDQAEQWNKTNKDLKGKINTEKVAMMGHSFGAYTTLVVCGAQPVLNFLNPQIGSGKGLAGDLSDSRVTFGFAMSPQSPGSVFFNRESYQKIDRPLICLSGSKDVQKSAKGTLMLPHHRLEVFRLLPPEKNTSSGSIKQII